MAIQPRHSNDNPTRTYTHTQTRDSIDGTHQPRSQQLLVACLFVGSLLVVGFTIFAGTAIAETAPECEIVTYEQDGETYLIENVSQLQCIESNGLDEDYRLVNDIDASETESWNDGAGFIPVGDGQGTFDGSFDGDGYRITDLYINTTSQNTFVGLFGVNNGTISNVSLTGDIQNTGSPGESATGSIAGLNKGVITDVSVDVSLDGESKVGGITGEDTGEIVNTRVVGTINGSDDVGGLVGTLLVADDVPQLNTSFAAASVTATQQDTVGGAVGGVENVTSGDSLDPGDVDFQTVYWDSDIVTTSNDFGTGLSTDRMTGMNATAMGGLDGFAFYDTWIPTASYPELTGEFFRQLSGDGSTEDPYVLDDVYDLQAIEAAPTGSYTIETTIDASETESWNDGAGFMPIGQETAFSGSFDGQGNMIEGLSIDREEDNVGLFADVTESGELSNLRLVEASVTGAENVGGLVASLDGSISDITYEGETVGFSQVGGLVGVTDTSASVTDIQVDADVTGAEELNINIIETAMESIGGVIGRNEGNIANLTVTGTVQSNGGDGIGGVVGTSANSDTAAGEADQIQSVHADVEVTATDSNEIGGIIGSASDWVVVTDIVVTGDVNGQNSVGGIVGVTRSDVVDTISTASVTGEDNVGGAVGRNDGIVLNTTATGDVSGETNAGGLVGLNVRSFGGGEVTNSSARGTVSGDTNIGGLVGLNEEGSIADTYAVGDVSGGSEYGGLIGTIDGGIVERSYAAGAVTDGGGGFAGELNQDPALMDVYWDTEASGVEDALGEGELGEDIEESVIGLTTDQMQGESSLTEMEFSFNPTWIATDEYPELVDHVLEYSAELDPSEIEVGETAQAIVTVELLADRSVTATEPATYTSDDSTVGSITDQGVITGESVGTVPLTASASGFSAVADITIFEAVEVSVSFEPSAPEEDDTVTFTIEITHPTDPFGTGMLEFEFDDEVVLSGDYEVVEGNTTREYVTDELSSGEYTWAALVESDTGATDTATGSFTIETTTTPSQSSSRTSTPTPTETPTPTPTPTDTPTPTEESSLTDASTETETPEPTETETETETPQEAAAVPPTSSGWTNASRVVVGGGAGAAASWLGIVLFSRTELFAAAAPEGVAKAVAAVPGAASALLAEPEQAAFVVGAVSVGDADDGVEVGETITFTIAIENKGDIVGARVISLALNEEEDSQALEVEPHETEPIQLEYVVKPEDAGKSLGFTIDCETDATDVTVEVGGEPIEETDETDETDDAIDEGTKTGLLNQIWLKKGKILSYTAGTFVLYIGFSNVQENLLAGSLSIFLGFMTLPPVRARLPTSTRVLISRYGKITFVVLAALLSGILFDTSALFATIEGFLGL